MARLIYTAITSLDGFVEDDDGAFDWAAPDEDVHNFVNALARTVGTYLYGHRMYETMLLWQTAPILADGPHSLNDFAEILAGYRQGRVLNVAGRRVKRPDDH